MRVRRWLARRSTDIALLGPVVLAIALRALPSLRAHSFDAALEYDDGVHVTLARAFAHGQLPYRDILFLHPPAIILLLQPAVWLSDLTGASVLACARLMTFGVAGLTTALLIRLVRPWGVRSAWIAGVAYAVMPFAVLAGSTAMLEPWLDVFVVAAALAVTRRRWVWAGAFLGLAASVKLWGAMPLLLLITVAFARRRPAVVRRVAAGAGAVLAVVITPFAIAAGPRVMVRDIVGAQLGRPHAGGPLDHLAGIVVARTDELATLPVTATRVAINLLIGAAAIAVVLALRRGRRPTLVVAAGALLLVWLVMFTVAPVWYPHYDGVLAPPLAVLIAAPARRSTGDAGFRLTALAVAFVAMIAGVMAAIGVRTPDRLDLQLLAAVPPGACVATDSTTVLAELPHVSPGSCGTIADLVGVDVAGGRTDVSVSRAAAIAWMRRADVVVVASGLVPVSVFSAPAVHDTIAREFREVAHGGDLEVWIRCTPADRSNSSGAQP